MKFLPSEVDLDQDHFISLAHSNWAESNATQSFDNSTFSDLIFDNATNGTLDHGGIVTGSVPLTSNETLVQG